MRSYQQNPENCCCQQKDPCDTQPIVMCPKVCVVHRYCWHEQPIICPVETKVVTHHCYQPRYYTTNSTINEEICHPYRQNNT